MSWDTTPVIDSAPRGRGARPTLGTSESDAPCYLELPESGWGALLGWMLGTQNLVCSPDRLPHTTWVVTHGDGGSGVSKRARSGAEQASIEDDVDDFLRGARVPPRPRGYRWFYALPKNRAGRDFWELIDSRVWRRLDEDEPVTPERLAALLDDLGRHLDETAKHSHKAIQSSAGASGTDRQRSELARSGAMAPRHQRSRTSAASSSAS